MKVACYCRVSTAEQDLQRQIESTTSYSEDRLGAELDAIEIYRDKSTGTDTERSGYHDLLDDVSDGTIDAVVAASVSRVSRSIRDLSETASRIVDDAGAELHIVEESLVITGDDDPYQTAMFQLLGVFAELEAQMTRQRVRDGIRTRMENDEYHHGRPPLGFTKDDGYLIETGDFDRVRSVLELVDADQMSKRQAARELDTSRRTINRALDRVELYSLD